MSIWNSYICTADTNFKQMKDHRSYVLNLSSWEQKTVFSFFLSRVILSLSGYFLVFSFHFQGFCGWSLVVYDRLLVPSNPANGVLRYKDNYYAFSHKQAAYEFANAPDRYYRIITSLASSLAYFLPFLLACFLACLPFLLVFLLAFPLACVSVCFFYLLSRLLSFLAFLLACKHRRISGCRFSPPRNDSRKYVCVWRLRTCLLLHLLAFLFVFLLASSRTCFLISSLLAFYLACLLFRMLASLFACFLAY